MEIYGVRVIGEHAPDKKALIQLKQMRSEDCFTGKWKPTKYVLKPMQCVTGTALQYSGKHGLALNCRIAENPALQASEKYELELTALQAVGNMGNDFLTTDAQLYSGCLGINKAGYTATLVACGWAGAVLERVTGATGWEPYAQKAQKRQKSKKGTDQPTDQPTAECRVAQHATKNISF